MFWSEIPTKIQSKLTYRSQVVEQNSVLASCGKTKTAFLGFSLVSLDQPGENTSRPHLAPSDAKRLSGRRLLRRAGELPQEPELPLEPLLLPRLAGGAAGALVSSAGRVRFFGSLPVFSGWANKNKQPDSWLTTQIRSKPKK